MVERERERSSQLLSSLADRWLDFYSVCSGSLFRVGGEGGDAITYLVF